MRKLLLSLFVLFICAISFGQRTAPASLPSPNSAGYSKVGFYRADSAFLLGIRTDTNWHPIVPALTSVKFAGQDTSRLYYWNGLNWQLAGTSSGGGANTPYVDSIYIRSGETTDSMFYLKNNVEYYWGVIDVANGLISGGQVTWTGTGYDFYVSAAVYRINGTRYTSRDTTLTLTSSDPTNPRIDVFVANTSGVATFLTGTATSNPVVPQIDPNTDVALTSILVTAASTSPTVDTATVYDENIEWTGTGVGVTINTANTAALTVYRGTYSTEINTLANNDYVKYVTGSPINVATKQSLSFFIRLKAGWTNPMNLRVRLYSGGTALGTELIIPISRTNFNWQGFSIPMANFALNSTVVDEVRFRFTSGGSVAGYYLDWVYFQSGVAPTPSADYVESVRRSGDSVQQYINGAWQYAFTVSDKADKTTELFAGWGVLGGGTLAANRTFAVDSSGTVASKLWTLDRIAAIPSGGITALTGDVTASGSGSVAATLATVNSNIGTFNNITINAKGLATAGSNISYLTADSIVLRRVGIGNVNHITSWNSTSSGGTTATLSADVSKDSANIFIGNQSGAANTSGVYNVGLGNSALRSNISGRSNVAFGTHALKSVTVSDRNTAFGQSALLNFNGGSGSTDNSAFGHFALGSLTTGVSNIAIGSSAGSGITDQSINIMIGNVTGLGNNTNRIGIGFISSSIGSYSLIIDNANGSTHSTGGSNTHVGYNSSGGGSGVEQSHFGLRAGSGVTGSGNTAIGVNSLGNYPNSATHSGTYNSALGYEAGLSQTVNITGSYNVALGHRAAFPSMTASSQFVLGGNDIRWLISDVSGSTRRWLFNATTTDVTAIANASAALEINGTAGGFLPPRMTGTQAEAISSPAEGLLIYSTDGSGTTITSKGWWGYNGSAWVKLN